MTITFIWTNEYQLTATAGSGGSVTGDTNIWVTHGATATVQALPAAYYDFSHWDGVDGASNAMLSLPAFQPATLTAQFTPSLTAVGVPELWYVGFGIAIDDSGDGDGDRALNWQEYRAGTDPTNAASAFRIAGLSTGAPPQTITLHSTRSNRYYRVLAGTRPDAVTNQVAAGPGTEPRTELSISNAPATGFLRGQVEDVP